MPIEFAGSKICDFLGLEILGVDILQTDLELYEGGSWESRLKFHDQPHGRHELLDLSGLMDCQFVCPLTSLPVHNSERERKIIAFAELKKRPEIENRSDNQFRGSLIQQEFIDLGFDLPK